MNAGLDAGPVQLGTVAVRYRGYAVPTPMLRMSYSGLTIPCNIKRSVPDREDQSQTEKTLRIRGPSSHRTNTISSLKGHYGVKRPTLS